MGVHYLMLNPVKNKSAHAIWLLPSHGGLWAPAFPPLQFWIFALLHPASSINFFLIIITLFTITMTVLIHIAFTLHSQSVSSCTILLSLIRASVLAFFLPLEHLKTSHWCCTERMSVGCFLRIKAMCAHLEPSDSSGDLKWQVTFLFLLSPNKPLPTVDPY